MVDEKKRERCGKGMEGKKIGWDEKKREIGNWKGKRDVGTCGGKVRVVWE